MSAEAWNELLTVGLLGTDRRDTPELAPGPIADVVADALRPTPQGRLLAAVSAVVVARRCGARPLPSRPPLMPPPPDPRPMVPSAAAQRWREIVANWPVLEPEWLAVASAARWRPSPDVLVAMLRRHRRSPHVGAAVVAFGGLLASWLIEHVPELAPSDPRRTLGTTSDAGVLPVPNEFEGLLDRADGALGDALVAGLDDGTFKWAHRTVLLNVIARLQPRALDPAIDALERGRAGLSGVAALERAGAPLSLWESLIELGVVRRAMLVELGGMP